MKTSFFTETILRVHHEFRLEIGRVSVGFRPGAHRSLLRGFGTEFRGFKQFELSDPLSVIDHFAAERLSENPEFEPVSRSYHPEHAISVFLLLDIRKSMEEPPRKMEHAAILLWMFALSTLKSQDQFRIILFGNTPLSDSGLLYEEAVIVDFFRHVAAKQTFFVRTPANSDIFSYFNTLSVRDALCIVVSDFTESWEKELRSLRRIDLSKKNLRVIFFALDEWADFAPTGFGMNMQDPRTGTVRCFSETELLAIQKSNQEKLKNIADRVRPLSIPFVSIPLLGDPLAIVRRELLRYGVE